MTLTGQVNSREEKRRAEDIADAVSGVKHVQNNLRVKDRSSSTSTSERSTTQLGGSTSTGAAGTSSSDSSGLSGSSGSTGSSGSSTSSNRPS